MHTNRLICVQHTRFAEYGEILALHVWQRESFIFDFPN